MIIPEGRVGRCGGTRDEYRGKGFEAVLEKTTVALVIFNLAFLDGVHLQTIGEDSLCL